MPRIQIQLTRETLTVRVELAHSDNDTIPPPSVIETTGHTLSERPGLAKARPRALSAARKAAGQ